MSGSLRRTLLHERWDVVSGRNVMSNVRRPELALLCYCARTQLGKQQSKHIKTLTERNLDWTYVVRMALAHRVMPLVYRSLSSTCLDTVPKTVLEQFQAHFYVNAGRNMFLAKELIKLLQLLESCKISAIPYKGPTLAVAIYGNLALRQFGDLDILVSERDYDRARHVFISRGFRPTIEHEWEVELTDQTGIVAVDLHKRITTREFSCPLNFKYLSRRLQPVRVADAQVAGLCPEDTLLMLSIQLTKDRYPQLSKICDVAELLRLHRRLNWVNTLKEAKRLGGERIVLFGVSLAHSLLGGALPAEMAHELRLHTSIHGLVNHASRQIFHPVDISVRDQLASQRFHWLVRERLRDKLYPYYLRYIHGVITPCEIDRRFVFLPERLSFLYYFFRPMRLMAKYGWLLARRAGLSVSLMSPESSKAVDRAQDIKISGNSTFTG